MEGKECAECDIHMTSKRRRRYDKDAKDGYASTWNHRVRA